VNAENFYCPTPEETLRFGDVILGFPILYATMDLAVQKTDHGRFTVSVDHPANAVVMSPCCSIRDGVISICILKPLHKKYFKAPKLKENPLLLNGKMLKKDVIPPEQWKNLSEEQRQQYETEELAYAFNEVFVFAPNLLLPELEVEIKGEKVKVGYHEIDFREACHIKSPAIKNPETRIAVNKKLQLTDDTREAFRDKLQSYYQRVGVAPV